MKRKKQMLRGILSMLISMSAVITMTPQVYAEAGALNVVEECTIEESQLNGEEAIYEIDEIAEAVNTSETEANLPDDVIEEKVKLSEMLSYLNTATEDVDYVKDIVYASADSIEEAQSVADVYNARLESFENGYAVFTLPEGLTVLEAVTLAADIDNDYPVIYPNLISKSTLNNIVCDSEEVSNNRAGYSSLSVISDRFDPYMNEKAVQSGYNSYQWHHEIIGSQYAWLNEIKGKNIRVAIIAEGINTSHIDAPTNIVSSMTIYNGMVVSDTSNVDETGYGTAMAGLVAAPQNNKLGMGIAPDADILNFKTDGTPLSVSSAIRYAADMNAAVIAVSSSYDIPVTNLELAIDYAYGKGSAVFAAAGNTGGSYDVFPAAYKNAICVGGTDKSNQRAGEYSYSNNIDISVPGVDLWTCDASNTNLYGGYSGNVLLGAVAAAEAALILDKANTGSIKAFLDSNGMPFKGAKKVDALVKYMKASTIKAGTGTGSGIVYLPKALGLDSSTGVPAAPVVTYDPVNSTYVGLHFRADAFTYCIYYTIDGKKPTYKNGKASDNAFYVYGNSSDAEGVYTTDIKTDNLTINAIAVNPFGAVSKVTTCTIPLTGYADSVTITGAGTLLAGKSTTMTAKVVPSNSKTKKVIWHVSYSGNENKAKENGVTIGTNGSLKALKTAVSGTYFVWAETIVSNRVSPKMAVNIYNTQIIKSIKPVTAKVAESYGFSSKVVAPSTLFNIEKIDGTPALPSDVTYTTSNSAVADIVAGDIYINNSGVAVITATANDGSGIKAACTLNVQQKVTGIYSSYNEYGNKVAKGKSITLNPIIVPDNSVIRKITRWWVDSNGVSNGIKVSNGKVTTTKNTAPGTYTIYCEITDFDGSKISSSTLIEVIDKEITKITVPKTINVFRTENNFSAKDFVELHIGVEGGERDSFNNCVYGAVRATYSDEGLFNTMYGPLTPETNGFVLPVKANGKGTGKFKITFEAMDGSGKKAVCAVNIVNPASSVKVAPAGLNVSNMTAGKTTAFKAVLGAEYGAVSDKKVEWSVVDGSTYATISNTGVLSVDKYTPDYTYICVRATAKDGSGAYGEWGMRVFKNPGKIEISNSAGNVTNPPKAVYEGCQDSFYVRVPRVGDAYEKIIGGNSYGNWKLSSANPDIATVRRNKGTPVITTSQYYVYYFEVLGFKKGSSKLTITTPDGSQSINVSISVLK